MIVEMVEFGVPAGWTRAEVVADALGTVEKWRADPDLLRKHYLLGEDGRCCGVYFWRSRAAAERAHDATWRRSVAERTGAAPTIRYFDPFLVVDNEQGSVTQLP